MESGYLLMMRNERLLVHFKVVKIEVVTWIFQAFLLVSFGCCMHYVVF